MAKLAGDEPPMENAKSLPSNDSAWQPTHLCEMGAEITAALLEQRLSSSVKASRCV